MADIKDSKQPVIGSNGFADSSIPYDKEAAEVRRLAGRNEYAIQLDNMSAEEYAAFEKKLLRKMDMRLVPWMT